jgi:hypothetical protein
MIMLSLLASGVFTANPDQGVGPLSTCPRGTVGEIIVCGEPSQQSPYRIDPAVAAVQRQQEAPRIAPPEYLRVGEEECSPHGLKLCAGMDTIPVSAIARVAAESTILAVIGEDWRQPFRTQADHYEEYREAKAREERRRSDRKARFGLSFKR